MVLLIRIDVAHDDGAVLSSSVLSYGMDPAHVDETANTAERWCPDLYDTLDDAILAACERAVAAGHRGHG
jgi:hypothetical protein